MNTMAKNKLKPRTNHRSFKKISEVDKMVADYRTASEDDWEVHNYGIDPELGGIYGIDFDDEVGFRD